MQLNLRALPRIAHSACGMYGTCVGLCIRACARMVHENKCEPTSHCVGVSTTVIGQHLHPYAVHVPGPNAQRTLHCHRSTFVAWRRASSMSLPNPLCNYMIWDNVYTLHTSCSARCDVQMARVNKNHKLSNDFFLSAAEFFRWLVIALRWLSLDQSLSIEVGRLAAKMSPSRVLQRTMWIQVAATLSPERCGSSH